MSLKTQLLRSAVMRSRRRTAHIGVRSLLRDYCRNRVLEYQLFLIVGFQNQRVLIEALDPAGELHTAHQIDRQDYFVPPGIV